MVAITAIVETVQPKKAASRQREAITRRHGTPQRTTGPLIAAAARAQLGVPYRYGGNEPRTGFDCSGLVDFVFLDAAGLSLPRSTRELIAMDAPKVRPGDLRPGDLLFFNPGGGAASHIGIYVGEGRFVHAPSSGGTVRLDVLSERYWQRC